jgi:phosphomevalonate kinase
MIVALTGQRKSGKSLIAKELYKLHPMFLRISFADAMKRRLAEKFFLNLNDLYAPLGKEKYRHLMQVFAEEEKKKDPAVWVKIVMEQVDAKPGDYIIDDLRFTIELEHLMKRKAKIVQVVSDWYSRTQRGADAGEHDPTMVAAINGHISENDVATLPVSVIRDLGGYIVYNNMPKPNYSRYSSDWEREAEMARIRLEAEKSLKLSVKSLFNKIKGELTIPAVG